MKPVARARGRGALACTANRFRDVGPAQRICGAVGLQTKIGVRIHKMGVAVVTVPVVASLLPSRPVPERGQAGVRSPERFGCFESVVQVVVYSVKGVFGAHPPRWATHGLCGRIRQVVVCDDVCRHIVVCGPVCPVTPIVGVRPCAVPIRIIPLADVEENVVADRVVAPTMDEYACCRSFPDIPRPPNVLA